MTRCERCDRPLAVENDHDGGCTCEQCSARCWSSWGVECKPVDWRSRALKAEAALAVEVAACDAWLRDCFKESVHHPGVMEVSEVGVIHAAYVHRARRDQPKETP